jgi:hypothetical protein
MITIFFKLLAVVIVALLAGGCASNSSRTEAIKQAINESEAWKAKTDPTPIDCARDADAIPKLPPVPHDGGMSAREYKRLRDYTEKEVGSAQRCRTWSRGQRQ